MKEFGEQTAGTTALLHRWNEARLRQRPHPASMLEAGVVRCATVQDSRASSVSDETRCGGVLDSLHNRSPFAIKITGAHCVVYLVARPLCVTCARQADCHGKGPFRTWGQVGTKSDKLIRCIDIDGPKYSIYGVLVGVHFTNAASTSSLVVLESGSPPGTSASAVVSVQTATRDARHVDGNLPPAPKLVM